jgi:hypothetical protein
LLSLPPILPTSTPTLPVDPTATASPPPGSTSDPTSPSPDATPTAPPVAIVGGTTSGTGSGGNPGGGGLDVPPAVLGDGLAPLDGVSLAGFGYTWAIPGVLVGASFAIILIVVIAQALAGMIMIPVARRVFRRRNETTAANAAQAGHAG